jgi:ATP-dependent Clp protease ATP-binding subunit ClpB
VTLEVTPAARELLGNMGYDPTYGARPLRRVIQKQLVDKLALALLEGRFHAGERVVAGAHDGQIVLEAASTQASA